MNDRHPHFHLIDLAGSNAVRAAFSLSPQALWNWKSRGIPDAQRLGFARLLQRAGHGIETLPADFLPPDAMQLLRLESAVREAATASEGQAA
jgi:hypothetical protein